MLVGTNSLDVRLALSRTLSSQPSVGDRQSQNHTQREVSIHTVCGRKKPYFTALSAYIHGVFEPTTRSVKVYQCLTSPVGALILMLLGIRVNGITVCIHANSMRTANNVHHVSHPLNHSYSFLSGCLEYKKTLGQCDHPQTRQSSLAHLSTFVKAITRHVSPTLWFHNYCPPTA